MYLVSKSNLMRVNLQPEDLGSQHHLPMAGGGGGAGGRNHKGIQSMKTSILSANSTLCFSNRLSSSLEDPPGE